MEKNAILQCMLLQYTQWTRYKFVQDQRPWINVGRSYLWWKVLLFLKIGHFFECQNTIPLGLTTFFKWPLSFLQSNKLIDSHNIEIGKKVNKNKIKNWENSSSRRVGVWELYFMNPIPPMELNLNLVANNIIQKDWVKRSLCPYSLCYMDV